MMQVLGSGFRENPSLTIQEELAIKPRHIDSKPCLRRLKVKYSRSADLRAGIEQQSTYGAYIIPMAKKSGRTVLGVRIGLKRGVGDGLSVIHGWATYCGRRFHAVPTVCELDN